jgi:transcriptional regulator with XRE-family HTH domain
MNTIPSSPPVPDPEWWMLPEVLPILAVRDISGLYRWLQKWGWSQQRIASLTGQSQPEVSGIMRGRRVTSYDLLVRIADGLLVPRVLMGLAGCADSEVPSGPVAKRGGDDAMERREFLAAVSVVAAGGSPAGLRRWLPAGPAAASPVPARIGASDVAQVRAMAAHLRALDERYGGGTTLDAARGFVGWAQGMLHSRYDEATGRDLKIALSELYLDVAYSANDAARRSEARRQQARALVLAREAEEPGLVAEVLMQIDKIALQYDTLASPRVSEHGLAMDSGACYPGTVAELHGNVARAAALRGDARNMGNALARADEALAEAGGAAVPVWAVQRAEMTARRAAGRGWLMIYAAVSRHRQHRRYADLVVERGTFSLADKSLGRRDSTQDRTELAAAQLRVGDLDAGLENAHAVLDGLPGLRSARARLWLADLSQAAADHAAHPDAADLRARIAIAN